MKISATGVEETVVWPTAEELEAQVGELEKLPQLTSADILKRIADAKRKNEAENRVKNRGRKLSTDRGKKSTKRSPTPRGLKAQGEADGLTVGGDGIQTGGGDGIHLGAGYVEAHKILSTPAGVQKDHVETLKQAEHVVARVRALEAQGIPDYNREVFGTEEPGAASGGVPSPTGRKRKSDEDSAAALAAAQQTMGTGGPTQLMSPGDASPRTVALNNQAVRDRMLALLAQLSSLAESNVQAAPGISGFLEKLGQQVETQLQRTQASSATSPEGTAQGGPSAATAGSADPAKEAATAGDEKVDMQGAAAGAAGIGSAAQAGASATAAKKARAEKQVERRTESVAAFCRRLLQDPEFAPNVPSPDDYNNNNFQSGNPGRFGEIAKQGFILPPGRNTLLSIGSTAGSKSTRAKSADRRSSKRLSGVKSTTRNSYTDAWSDDVGGGRRSVSGRRSSSGRKSSSSPVPSKGRTTAFVSALLADGDVSSTKKGGVRKQNPWVGLGSEPSHEKEFGSQELQSCVDLFQTLKQTGELNAGERLLSDISKKINGQKQKPSGAAAKSPKKKRESSQYAKSGDAAGLRFHYPSGNDDGGSSPEMLPPADPSARPARPQQAPSEVPAFMRMAGSPTSLGQTTWSRLFEQQVQGSNGSILQQEDDEIENDVSASPEKKAAAQQRKAFGQLQQMQRSILESNLRKVERVSRDQAAGVGTSVSGPTNPSAAAKPTEKSGERGGKAGQKRAIAGKSNLPGGTRLAQGQEADTLVSLNGKKTVDRQARRAGGAAYGKEDASLSGKAGAMSAESRVVLSAKRASLASSLGAREQSVDGTDVVDTTHIRVSVSSAAAPDAPDLASAGGSVRVKKLQRRTISNKLKDNSLKRFSGGSGGSASRSRSPVKLDGYSPNTELHLKWSEGGSDRDSSAPRKARSRSPPQSPSRAERSLALKAEGKGRASLLKLTSSGSRSASASPDRIGRLAPEGVSGRYRTVEPGKSERKNSRGDKAGKIAKVSRGRFEGGHNAPMDVVLDMDEPQLPREETGSIVAHSQGAVPLDFVSELVLQKSREMATIPGRQTNRVFSEGYHQPRPRKLNAAHEHLLRSHHLCGPPLPFTESSTEPSDSIKGQTRENLSTFGTVVRSPADVAEQFPMEDPSRFERPDGWRGAAAIEYLERLSSSCEA